MEQKKLRAEAIAWAEDQNWDGKEPAKDSGQFYYKAKLLVDWGETVDPKSVSKILDGNHMTSDGPMDNFNEWLADTYFDDVCDEQDDMAEQIMNRVVEKYGVTLDDDDENFIRDWVCDFVEFGPPADYFLDQRMCFNLMMDTGDANYDFAINCRYPAWGGDDGPIPKESALVWLAETQGYTERELRDALNKGDMADPHGFLETMRVDMANANSSMLVVTFLVKTTLRKAIQINELLWKRKEKGESYIAIGKNTETGLFDPWYGAGSPFEIELEKDINVPIKYIRSFLPDGYDGQHSVRNVYGVDDTLWRDTLKGIKEITTEN